MSYILAIDQGTTSSRAIVFDSDMRSVAMAQQEFTQHFPASGWVEHEPEDLWRMTIESCQSALHSANIRAEQLAGIGITNQRETTLIWDRHSGEAIHRAIVWQDRRTAPVCQQLRDAGHEALFSATTGLLLDPYFSGTKVQWLLEHVDGARERAERGDLLFGTVDSYLIWRMTGRHVTDATNAARTLLYDIHQGCWSEDICAILGVPLSMLPEVLDCAADFGVTDILGASVPILGVAGDQQAATLGQACFAPGMLKSTYGTGCFALLNTGEAPVKSENKLLTTIAYQLNGKPTYALEGSIFIAGAVVQWLRDGLKIVDDAAQSNVLAQQADAEQGVVLVPAFTGLGAPYWNPDCRGAMFGITRATTAAEIARAALESVAHQTRDLLDAMRADWPAAQASASVLRVDGGMSASDWTMQYLADLLDAKVDRPQVLETTALGVAWLAGMRAGIYPDQEGFAANWALDTQFTPTMPATERNARHARWQRAVAATLSV